MTKYWVKHAPSGRSLEASNDIAALLSLADAACVNSPPDRIAIELQLLPGLTSIVEEFLRDRLLEHFGDKAIALGEPWINAIWKVREDAVDKGWAGIRDGWSNLAGISLSAAAGKNWELFDAVREVRNAYVHGSGQLTRRQRQTESKVRGTVAKLKPWGIELNAVHRIEVRRPFLRTAGGVARMTIVDVDSAGVAQGFAT
jgi:hypothetical protein